ncbi:MAG: hypothetical protein AB7G48_13820 [Nitrospiraceae bacterium]
MLTKKKKQSKDTFQIAREVVEAAIGEQLVPSSGRKPKKRSAKKK